MELKIVRADPAGNITVFVLDPPSNEKIRADAAMTLLADPGLGAEQVGFVSFAKGIWRLEMAGGEFCGNASRSAALLAASMQGLSGRHTLIIETSGMSAPLPVLIDTVAQTAEIAIPGPIEETFINLEGRIFPVYVFEGITHIIAEDIESDEILARELINKMDNRMDKSSKNDQGNGSCSAMGVMFYDTDKRFMRPIVWTRMMDTFVFESSCGSGSAALGVWILRSVQDAETSIELVQPGGTITVCITKQAGVITHLSIGGHVTFGEVLNYRY
jgi:diaminopimelate epimerase